MNNEIENAEVLITVKTYPRPTPAYDEIVCTAGILNNGSWIRIYPIPFRNMPYSQQYKKYDWIRLDLVKKKTDERIESYSPKKMFDEKIMIEGHIGTDKKWEERKNLLLKNVYLSMQDLIDDSYHQKKSLGVVKPKEIINFKITTEKRNWEKRYIDRMQQMRLFSTVNSSLPSHKRIVKKLPYSFSYEFITDDNMKRQMSIFDWEIGALFWNCLKSSKGDEKIALQKVREKYFDEFVSKKDVFFFMGSNYSYFKRKFPNPFSIVGVFYPPK